MSDKIYIFDTTLRDGEQVPGAKLSKSEKVKLALMLEDLAVDIIEAGFPISSPEDFTSVQEVAKQVKKATICALSRAVTIDIETAAKSIEHAQKGRIHTFAPVSDLQMQKQLKKSKPEVLEMVHNSVSLAKTYSDDVEFSPMDASRADFNFLIDVIRIAIKAGAQTINLPDTVGYALPEEFGHLVKQIYDSVSEFKQDAIMSVHTHNDLGLASANALSGMVNGARQIECTMNGIGERAGNCALEEVVMAIKTRYNDKFYTDVQSKKLCKSSACISDVMGLPVQPNKAIVGANAFAHSSGIHQDGVLKHRTTYEIINPDDVGAEMSSIILTARSGRAAVKHRLSLLGYDVKNGQIDDVYTEFLNMADAMKEVNDENLKDLMKKNK